MMRTLAALQSTAQRLRREEGATAVEYGLMVALIAAVIIGAVSALGLNVRDTFQTVADTVGGV